MACVISPITSWQALDIGQLIVFFFFFYHLLLNQLQLFEREDHRQEDPSEWSSQGPAFDTKLWLPPDP